MGAIAEIFRTFGPQYLALYGDAMPENHRKVINAIIECRTPAAGLAVFECEDCHQIHIVYQSCGNRHCPSCQNKKAMEWLHKQLLRQLPGHHFMITFTVPEQIRPFFSANQKDAYNSLFSASADSIKKMTLDERFIGADLSGFFGVLHTWGRQLPYHPHVHYVVPGGAFSTKDHQWKPSGLAFFLPVMALALIFRAKFKDEMAKLGLLHLIPEEVWQIAWNVNCQAVGSGETAIRYLAPYVFKVAISDHRIKEVNGRSVTFSYTKSGSNRQRSMTLDVMEFMRRFLQHVLPTGFMKVRYYGFMSPNASVSLDELRGRIELASGFDIETPATETKPVQPINCPACGGRLKLRLLILQHITIFVKPG